MARKGRKLYDLILSVLKDSPEGVSIHDLRERLPDDIGPQAELNKRVRELRYQHDIPYEDGKYHYKGERARPLDNQGISAKLRAAVLNMAHGRCQMCGRTVTEDGIKLQVDHKVPHNWGGPTVLENLWAICELCNSGKRDFFKSLDDDEMTRLVAIDSVHARLAEALHMNKGKAISSWLLEFVANVNDFQEDWQRRLRELRVLGIDYKFNKERLPSGKVQTTYTLTKWKPLPKDPRAEIRKIERGRN